MRVNVRSSLLISALSLAAFIPSHAQLITNGGFETGDFSGWTTSSLNATAVEPSGFDGYAAHSGTYFAALGNVGTQGIIVSNTFSDTPGTVYDFSFYLASNGSANNFAATVDGTTVFGPSDIGPQGYTLYSFDFVGTGSDTVGFSERDDPSYLALDDISVNAATAATPEPSSLMLMGTGVLGMAGVLRRRFNRG